MFEFTLMDKKRRELYECMWGSAEFDFPVERTFYNGSRTPNSYTFTKTLTENGDVCEDICRERLVELFAIADKDLFERKFEQSISGSGQELKRIATVHSSSLCALLFFYNVSGKNPYTMKIGGEEYIFTYSRFEYQNKVIEGRNPSNIDVVLVGKHKKTEKQVVFFVESKFSEYFERPEKKLAVSTEYLKNKYSEPIYRSSCMDEMGLHIAEISDDKNFLLVSDETCYVEGIKQMISHYVGVRNFCDMLKKKGKIDMGDDDNENVVLDGAKILLGEILFTEGIGQLSIGNGKKVFDSYQGKCRILAGALNEQLCIDGMSEQVSVLADILSYSQFQNSRCIKEEIIKRFYFEMGKVNS